MRREPSGGGPTFRPSLVPGFVRALLRGSIRSSLAIPCKWPTMLDAGLMTGIVHAGATKPSARTFPLNPLNFPLPTLLNQQHFSEIKKTLAAVSLAIV